MNHFIRVKVYIHDQTTIRLVVAIPALATALVLNSGCNPSGGNPTNNPETSRQNLEPTAADAKPERNDKHHHRTVPYRPWNTNQAHTAESWFHWAVTAITWKQLSTPRESFRLYTLGQDESRVIER